MLRSWKFYLAMGGIAAVMAVFAYGFFTNPKIVPSPLVNKPAPAFDITDMHTGESINNAKLKGKPYILNFWASWCVACRDEAIVLEEANQRYDKGAGVARVIGIAIQDTPEKAKAFARKFGKTYFLGMDGNNGEISLSYGLYGVPESFFVDSKGIIRYKQIGAVTRKVVDEWMDKLVKENQQ